MISFHLKQVVLSAVLIALGMCDGQTPTGPLSPFTGIMGCNNQLSVEVKQPPTMTFMGEGGRE